MLKIRHIGGPALDITELLESVKTVNILWVDSKLKSPFGFNCATYNNIPKCHLVHSSHPSQFRMGETVRNGHLVNKQGD